MNARPLVLKLGGRSLEAPGALEALCRDVAAHPGPVVLVHGGGAEVSAWSARLGIEPRFVDGLRVTDAAALEVAVAVLAGLANKRLVAALRAAGADAVGLAALDGGTAIVAPHARRDALGEVGEVLATDPTLVRALLGAGRRPVLASIGDHAGRLLNVNADDLAAALAGALAAASLVLLSDTPGVRLGGAPVGALTCAAARAALEHPEVTGGMRPKLAAAIAAVEGGALEARIAAWPGSLAALLAGAVGTRIAPGAVAPDSAAVAAEVRRG